MISALGHLKAVDVSDTIAGQYCCRLLSDFGARTVLAEPSAGASTRRIGPFDKEGQSLTYLHLNAGKERVTLPATAQEEALAALLADADIIVTSDGAAAEAISRGHPDAVVIDITAFGADGPYRDWQGPELVVQALSGMMNSNGLAGREPLFGVGNRASYAAGVAGYISAMAAVLARGRGQRGQRASVDIAETAAAMSFPYVLQYEFNGTDRRRGDQDIPAGQVLCSGTWVCIWVYPFRFEAACRTLGIEACIDDPRFAETEARAKNWDAFFAIIQEKVRDRDAEEVVRDLQNAQVIAACAYRPGELQTSPHLKARQYWEQIEFDGQQRMILGPPFRLSRTPRSLGSKSGKRQEFSA